MLAPSGLLVVIDMLRSPNPFVDEALSQLPVTGAGADSWSELELMEALWKVGFGHTEVVAKSFGLPSVVLAFKGQPPSDAASAAAASAAAAAPYPPSRGKGKKRVKQELSSSAQPSTVASPALLLVSAANMSVG
jgi:hypothetical protein